jgi:hypothetical protein
VLAQRCRAACHDIPTGVAMAVREMPAVRAVATASSRDRAHCRSPGRRRHPAAFQSLGADLDQGLPFRSLVPHASAHGIGPHGQRRRRAAAPRPARRPVAARNCVGFAGAGDGSRRECGYPLPEDPTQAPEPTRVPSGAESPCWDGQWAPWDSNPQPTDQGALAGCRRASDGVGSCRRPCLLSLLASAQVG